MRRVNLIRPVNALSSTWQEAATTCFVLLVGKQLIAIGVESKDRAQASACCVESDSSCRIFCRNELGVFVSNRTHAAGFCVDSDSSFGIFVSNATQAAGFCVEPDSSCKILRRTELKLPDFVSNATQALGF